MTTKLDKLKFNAEYGTLGSPPKPEPVPREEGQCDWCSFRATDVCGLGHSCKDHCMSMEHRGLECPDYMWYGTSQELAHAFIKRQELDLMTGAYKWCKCRDRTRYARAYMKVFRWFKDWQYNRLVRKCEEETRKEMESLGLHPVGEDTGIMRTEFEGELFEAKLSPLYIEETEEFPKISKNFPEEE